MMHHAYYIEGPGSWFDAYKEELKPYYARRYERFGIEEARELAALASLKNYTQAVFLLGISALTSEAQQALLKLFEEPQKGTQFVVLVPHGILMPTLRSRMMHYPNLPQGSALSARSNLAVQEFFKSSGKDRSDFIAKLLKEEDKEKVRDFINALEAEVYKKSKARSDDALRQALEDIGMVRDYLRDRSPSLKMLLEHLALALPKG